MPTIEQRLSALESSVGEIQRNPAPFTPKNSLANITAATALVFDFSMEEMTGRSRTESLADARQVAMWIARQLTSRSLGEIGTFFGRDHSTVIHACDVVPDKMEQSKDFARNARSALAAAKHAIGQGGASK